MPRYRRGFDTQEAFAHLARRDRKLGQWMKRIGPIDADARCRRSFDPVDALARPLPYLQPSATAADTTLGPLVHALRRARSPRDTTRRARRERRARRRLCDDKPPALRGRAPPATTG